MSPKLQRLQGAIESILGTRPVERLGELTLEAKDWKSTAIQLRDHPDLRFEQLIDLCGVDYQTYGDRPWRGGRFAVAVHLLSVSHNWRLRLRGFCPDDEFPLLPSLVEVWPGVNWY